MKASIFKWADVGLLLGIFVGFVAELSAVGASKFETGALVVQLFSFGIVGAMLGAVFALLLGLRGRGSRRNRRSGR